MDDNRILLHEKARAEQPDIPRKPEEYLVAVFTHGKSPSNQSGNFLWFKCKPTITVVKVRNQYIRRTSIRAELRFGASVPADVTTIKFLNHFNDNLVVFQAIELEAHDVPNEEAAAGRHALQVVNKQVVNKQVTNNNVPGNTPLSHEIKEQPVSKWNSHYISPPNQASNPTQTTFHVKSEPPVVDSGLSFTNPVYSSRSTVWQSYPSQNSVQASSRVDGKDFTKRSFDTGPVFNDATMSQTTNFNQEFVWPTEHRENISNAAARLLSSIPANHGKIIRPNQMLYLMQQNPSCSALCNILERAGWAFDRATFATTLLAEIPRAGPAPPKSMPYSYTPALTAGANPYSATNGRLNGEASGSANNLQKVSVAEPPRVIALGRLMGSLSPEPDHRADQRTPLPQILSKTPTLNNTQYEKFQKMLADATPEMLEAEVQKSIGQLNHIRVSLVSLSATNRQAAQWLEQLENTKNQNASQPTIIGVVGNTGAGKSSVINALLDEERLVPTNCMRACTAVVTEMSWNTSVDAESKYRAAIEFIQPEDWEKELRVLFAEILDSNGNMSSDIYSQDSEAGIAYAKIKAVYPQMSKDDLLKTSVEAMMRQPVIGAVLGTTKNIKESVCSNFYKRLQFYVDSKEKSTSKADKKEAKQAEFWPLIKVVRIYVKAEALRTGAVVVDLPGVHDSNAARSAVAARYMKQCTGLWILAPINRAVDDKAAKFLLGESFKRQLKYDGTYSRVTFICSKTDDISVTEASDSLGLDEEMSSKWAKIDQLEEKQKEMKKQLDELKDSNTLYGEVISDVDDNLEVWEKLQEDLEDGKTVYEPVEESKKRKRGANAPSNPRKKRASSSDGELDDEDSATSSFGADNTDDTVARKILTAEDIEAKLADLKTMKKEARLEKRRLASQIEEVKKGIASAKSESAAIDAEMSAICIAGRNKYSKGAIQQDFAAGIRELDQENAIEQDEANFDPEQDIRDYNEVARSLPVFCVSSRAYQKLSGRLQRDAKVTGFKTIEETEIPQLRAHCQKLTETGRSATCRRFLNNVALLLNSMSLWATTDTPSLNLSESQLATEARFLKLQLAQLEKALEKGVRESLEEMKLVLSENIYEQFEPIVEKAINEANGIVNKWGAPVNRANRAEGGLYYGTYKAIVRRDGAYSNAQGPHNFNEDLTAPIIKHLGSHWEKAFARKLPSVLQAFTKKIMPVLKEFHSIVESRASERGVGAAGINMLGRQLHSYEGILHDLTTQLMEVMNTIQRDANRLFTPVIARNLTSAYEHCTTDCGTGVFMRMKTHMSAHVNNARQTMFHESTKEVQTKLAEMCREMEAVMFTKAEDVFLQMRRDYMTVFTGSNVGDGTPMPSWQRSLLDNIARLINECDIGEDTTEKSFATASMINSGTASVTDSDLANLPTAALGQHVQDKADDHENPSSDHAKNRIKTEKEPAEVSFAMENEFEDQAPSNQLKSEAGICI